MSEVWRDSPFNERGEWSWPSGIRVQVSGGLAVLRSEQFTADAPELRALMLLEAQAGFRDVLTAPVERVRLELGSGWSEREVARAALRLGLFGDYIRSRLELVHGGRVVPLGRGYADLAGLVPDLSSPAERLGGSGFVPLRRALDRLLERAAAVLDGADEPDGAPIALVTRGSRPHPRLHWPVAHLAAPLPSLLSLEHVAAARSGWIGELETRLAGYRESIGARPGLHRDREYPFILEERRALESIWQEVRDRLSPHEKRMFHSAVANLKSSQAFALNLLGGLQHAGLLAAALSGDYPDLAAATVEFEVFDDGTRAFLGESDPEHQTQIDALLTLAMRDGSQVGLVVEVKLTERAFGACRGPRSEENQRRDLCDGSGNGPADERPVGCYLKTRHGRNYLDLLPRLPAAFAGLYGAEGCPLRSDGYQLARNLLLADYLREPREVLGKERRFARTSMAVLCVQKTGALVRNQEQLAQLGIKLLDAARLVAAARKQAEGPATPAQTAFFGFLESRYPGLF